MTKANYGQNMLLITSYWGDKDTFKLMPLFQDCPYSEVIYDPSSSMLVVISKDSKEQFQTIPRLDEDGSMVKAKKPKTNGKAHKEQRVTMNILTEHYVVEKDEQESFIKAFAVNAEEYDYSKFLRDMDKEPTIMSVETPGLVDGTGNPLVKA
jgi:hypothetical protein